MFPRLMNEMRIIYKTFDRCDPSFLSVLFPVLSFGDSESFFLGRLKLTASFYSFTLLRSPVHFRIR